MLHLNNTPANLVTDIQFPQVSLNTDPGVATLVSGNTAFKILERGRYMISYQFQIGDGQNNEYPSSARPSVLLLVDDTVVETTTAIRSDRIYHSGDKTLLLNAGDRVRLVALATGSNQYLANYGIIIRRIG